MWYAVRVCLLVVLPTLACFFVGFPFDSVRPFRRQLSFYLVFPVGVGAGFFLLGLPIAIGRGLRDALCRDRTLSHPTRITQSSRRNVLSEQRLE